MRIKKTALILITILSMVSIPFMGVASNAKSDKNIFERVTGTWAWTKPGKDCKSQPSDYIFGSNNKTMQIIGAKPTKMHDRTTRDYVNYKVISSDNTSITMSMENETRKYKSGKPIVWKLVLVSKDKFFWEVVDRPGRQFGPLVRCK